MLNPKLKNVYSTEEKVIGTWINGKPLYRKVFTGNVTTKQLVIDSGIENLDEIIYFGGTLKVSVDGQYRPLPMYGSDTNRNALEYNTSANKIYVDSSTGQWALGHCIIVLEYTKTTD